MATTDIAIRGAREHNLRDVSLDLPRGTLICFTGVSGSGKSSLAFDTLYAEGQRRYVESLSSYARQFLGQMPKPEVDRIDGLSPSISIQQKTGGRNPRSTVGTITEINDYLRVLYARVGQGHCPQCDRPVAAQTREQIVARILDLPDGTAYSVLAPVVRGQKGEYKDLFDELSRAGYVRARVNGQVVALSDRLSLDRQTKHNIEVVIDRLKAGPAVRARLAEAVEAALRLGEGTVIVAVEGRPDLLLSSHYACAACGISFEQPSPQLFSFNSPQGMCPSCDGLGVRHDLDPALLVPDPVAVGLGGGDRAARAGQGDRQVAPAPVRGGRRQPGGRPRRPPQGGDAQGALEGPRPPIPARLALRPGRSRARLPLAQPRQALVAHRDLAGRRRRADGQVPRRRGRPDPRQARTVHAEHDLPRLPRGPAQPPRPRRPRRRPDAGRARRDADRPRRPVLRRRWPARADTR